MRRSLADLDDLGGIRTPRRPAIPVRYSRLAHLGRIAWLPTLFLPASSALAAPQFQEPFAAQARITRAEYQRQYQESLSDPDGYWARIGQRLEDFVDVRGRGPFGNLRRWQFSSSCRS